MRQRGMRQRVSPEPQPHRPGECSLRLHQGVVEILLGHALTVLTHRQHNRRPLD